ncbi:MAG: glycosyltransferase family 39 protein [Planctomycetia bacterium]|nr:glycosyltransferase family 39 protein [Planctomycetia bacterium]
MSALKGERSNLTEAHVAGEGPARVELALVLVVSLVGLGLRVALPGRMAVEHFDEGVYASNFFFSGDKGDERYPKQHLYAPPLVPILIELTMVAFGPSNIAALAVSIVAGSLTVPLMWWVGRRWFGPAAGLAAATLVAFHDVHILFSRTALTDTLLCYVLLVAVHCFWVAQTSRHWFAIVAAGILTGLAWWTKYNGWLALAIGLAGVIAWIVFDRWPLESRPTGPAQNSRRQVKSVPTVLVIWAAVAAIALAVWGPWLWSLQDKGGYTAVAANHRGYFVGFAGWGASFAAQARKLSLLSGPMTGGSALVAFVVALGWLRSSGPGFTWNALLRNNFIFFALPVLCLVCVIEGAGVILAFLGIVGAVVGIARIANDRSIDDRSRGSSLAACLLAVWVAGLVVSIPMYTDYPRLVLPLLIACSLGAGVLVDACVAEIRRNATSLRGAVDSEPSLSRRGSTGQAVARIKPVYLLALGVGIVMAVTQSSVRERGIVGWQSRAGLADLAPEIRDDIARNAGANLRTGLDEFVIYTYGEPALLFQLRRTGCTYVKPVKDLRFAEPDAAVPKLPSFVAFGHQAWYTPGFGEQLAPGLPRLQLVGKYRYYPSDVVLLDSPDRHKQRPQYELEVYRVK